MPLLLQLQNWSLVAQFAFALGRIAVLGRRRYRDTFIRTFRQFDLPDGGKAKNSLSWEADLAFELWRTLGTFNQKVLDFVKMVGPDRLELSTSVLSGLRSNHLSYGPKEEKGPWLTLPPSICRPPAQCQRIRAPP